MSFDLLTLSILAAFVFAVLLLVGFGGLIHIVELMNSMEEY